MFGVEYAVDEAPVLAACPLVVRAVPRGLFVAAAAARLAALLRADVERSGADALDAAQCVGERPARLGG